MNKRAVMNQATRHASGPPPQVASAVQLHGAVSVQDMQQIDRTAIRTMGIPRLLLMEHAGLAVARAVRTLRAESRGHVLVCCGLGYNGGDGLCAARHLAQEGYRLRVVLLGSIERLKDEPATYARILKALAVPIIEAESADQLRVTQKALGHADVLIDALLGIGLQGPVRPLYAQLITWMNEAGKPIVSVDIPSGLDADTGLPHEVAVHATVTVTFGLAKQGCFCGQGPAHVGQLIVDGIGIPPRLLRPSTR